MALSLSRAVEQRFAQDPDLPTWESGLIARDADLVILSTATTTTTRTARSRASRSAHASTATARPPRSAAVQPTCECSLISKCTETERQVVAARFSRIPDRMSHVPPGAVFGTFLREIDDPAELVLLHAARLAPRAAADAALPASPELPADVSRWSGRRTRSKEYDVAAALQSTAQSRGTAKRRKRWSTRRRACFEHARQRADRPRACRRYRSLDGFGTAAATRAEPADERSTIYARTSRTSACSRRSLRAARGTNLLAAWIEDAFREAVAQNKRSWRYGILENWASRGRGTRNGLRRPGPLRITRLSPDTPRTPRPTLTTQP